MIRVARKWVLGSALICGSLLASSALAQEYGVYLLCKGQVLVKGRALKSHIDLALRRNDQTVLIQRSDVLPAAQKMSMQITPQFYTMELLLPSQGSSVYFDWLRGRLVVWDPDLKKLRTVRMSVNRQTAALEGDMRDNGGSSVGRINMTCEPSDNESVPEPKF